MLVAASALLIACVGCAEKPAPTPEPKVAPPAVKTAGVLTAGVDLSVPPFAGSDQGQQAGIDVDVAAALAEQLGLTVKYVDVKPSDAATALASGTADVVFSVPFTGSGAQLELAGTYLTNAPAFFVATDSTASVEPSLTLTTVTADKIGAQAESQAYWLLRHELEPETVESYGTLREAIEALDGGSVGLIAGDALVAAYIARDFPNVHFAGQAASASPLAVAVAPENTTLAGAVSDSLDRLAADGILGFIRDKWVPGLPELQVAESAEATPTQ
jgi:polar amino acid transport system substrate-binding protein